MQMTTNELEKNLALKSAEMAQVTKRLDNVTNEKTALENSLESTRMASKCEGETWAAERERLEGDILACKKRLERILKKRAEADQVVQRELKDGKVRLDKMRKQMQVMEREEGEREREIETLRKKFKRSELKYAIEREEGERKREEDRTTTKVVVNKETRTGEFIDNNKKWTTLQPTRDNRGGTTTVSVVGSKDGVSHPKLGSSNMI